MASDVNTRPIFERQKSGYVRDFKTLDVFIFNVLGFALGLAISTNPPFIGSFAPSANIVAVILLGALLSLFNGLNYGWFGAIMPSTGGDFIFVSRSINHRLGFLTSWGFTVTQIYAMAINVGWILAVGIAPALVSLGVSINQPRLIAFGNMLSKPPVVAVGSVVLIGCYFLLVYFEKGVSRYVIYPLFVMALSGPILMAYTLYTHSHGEFVSGFNAFMQKLSGMPDAYNIAVETAKQSGMSINPKEQWLASLQALPLGFLCFIGFTYSVYVGGEVVEPKKSQVRGIISALVLGIIFFVVCMGRYVSVVGQEFHSAVGFPPVMEKLGLPGNSMNLFAGIMAPSATVNVLMQIGNLLWFLLVPYVILQVCTHNVVAWTGDRLMPQAFNKRSRATNAPWLGSLSVCLAAMVFVVVNYFFGISLVGAVALVAIPYLLTGLSAFTLPRKDPDAFSKAPPAARKQFLGLRLFQIVGLISAIGFVWIIYAAVFYPEIRGGSRGRTAVVLVMVYGIGLVIYEIGKAKLKQLETRTGVNLDALFKEIPQD